MVLLRKFEPEKYRRRSIRLQNWDYSWAGIYFVTMRIAVTGVSFGQVKSGKMELNEFGEIVANTWMDLSNHYEDIELDEWIVMPDHFHGIVVIRKSNDNCIGTKPVGAIHESPQR